MQARSVRGMAKSFQKGRRKAARPVADKAKGGRRAYVMKP